MGLIFIRFLDFFVFLYFGFRFVCFFISKIIDIKLLYIKVICIKLFVHFLQVDIGHLDIIKLKQLKDEKIVM